MKKGQHLEIIADITFALLMLLGTYFFVRTVILNTAEIETSIFRESVTDLDNDELMVQLLNYEHLGERLGDIIIDSYLRDDKDALKDILSIVFRRIYDTEMCYELIIDEYKVDVTCSKKEDYPLIDSKIIVPLSPNPYQDSAMIELKVEGFA